MNRDEHRAKALALLSVASQGELQPADPHRLAIIAEAQLHATLAITAALIDNPPPRKRAAAKKVAQSKETPK